MSWSSVLFMYILIWCCNNEKSVLRQWPLRNRGNTVLAGPPLTIVVAKVSTLEALRRVSPLRETEGLHL